MRILRGILLTIIVIIGITLIFGISWGADVLLCAGIIKLLSLIAPIVFTWKLSVVIGTILWLINILIKKPLTNTAYEKAQKYFKDYR